MRSAICSLVIALPLLAGCATGNGSLRPDGFHPEFEKLVADVDFAAQ